MSITRRFRLSEHLHPRPRQLRLADAQHTGVAFRSVLQWAPCALVKHVRLGFQCIG
jgi:hypothetical protein